MAVTAAPALGPRMIRGVDDPSGPYLLVSISRMLSAPLNPAKGWVFGNSASFAVRWLKEELMRVQYLAKLKSPTLNPNAAIRPEREREKEREENGKGRNVWSE